MQHGVRPGTGFASEMCFNLGYAYPTTGGNTIALMNGVCADNVSFDVAFESIFSTGPKDDLTDPREVNEKMRALYRSLLGTFS